MTWHSIVVKYYGTTISTPHNSRDNVTVGKLEGDGYPLPLPLSSFYFICSRLAALSTSIWEVVFYYGLFHLTMVAFIAITATATTTEVPISEWINNGIDK